MFFMPMSRTECAQFRTLPTLAQFERETPAGCGKERWSGDLGKITQKKPKSGTVKKAGKAPLGRQDFTQEGDDRTTGGPKAGSGSGDVGRGDADGVVQRVVGEVAVHREWRGDL